MKLIPAAAMGGKARAEALSPEDRSEIARHAAQARWGAADDLTLFPKETHPGIIKIGHREIPCGVLDNGLRVFSTRGINRAMGLKKTGAPEATKDGAPQLPAFLASTGLRPFIPNELAVRLISPLIYRPKHGGRTAFGYEATLLPMICEVLPSRRRMVL